MPDERKTAMRKATTGNPGAGKFSPTSVFTRDTFMRDLGKVAAKPPKK